MMMMTRLESFGQINRFHDPRNNVFNTSVFAGPENKIPFKSPHSKTDSSLSHSPNQVALNIVGSQLPTTHTAGPAPIVDRSGTYTPKPLQYTAVLSSTAPGGYKANIDYYDKGWFSNRTLPLAGGTEGKSPIPSPDDLDILDIAKAHLSARSKDIGNLLVAGAQNTLDFKDSVVKNALDLKGSILNGAMGAYEGAHTFVTKDIPGIFGKLFTDPGKFFLKSAIDFLAPLKSKLSFISDKVSSSLSDISGENLLNSALNLVKAPFNFASWFGEKLPFSRSNTDSTVLPSEKPKEEKSVQAHDFGVT